MARRRNKKLRGSRRLPDTMFGSVLVRHLTNTVMLDGKYHVAYAAVCQALRGAASQLFAGEVSETNMKEKVVELMDRLIDQVGPHTEIQSRRQGGSTVPVPTPVRPERRVSMAFRMLVRHARKRKGMPFAQALMREMVDAMNETGGAFNEKTNILRMAKANIAFASR